MNSDPMGSPQRLEGSASVFDRPVHPLVDRWAARAAERSRHPARAALLVSVVGFVGLVVGLVVVGAILTHVGFLHGLRSWDEHVNRALARRRTGSWTSLSSDASGSAETLPIVLGGLLTEAVLALLKRWRDLLLVAIGLALEITVFLAVNETVRRPRPVVVRIGSLPKTFSFPSGHVAATVVLYGGLAMLLSLTARRRIVAWLAWTVVVVAAVTVGFGRVYRGMHHLTDVVAGAAMGSCCLLIAAVAARASALAVHPPDSQSPAPSPAQPEKSEVLT